MSFSFKTASDYTHAELADLFNRGFEDYFMPIEFDEQHFSVFVARDKIDLALSRVLLHENQAIGLGMISKRGESSRLAAMGIAKDWRNKGTGAWLLTQLMDEARQRGETKMWLEVIVQNDSAVHLYEKFGFKKTRQLFGFIGQKPTGKPDDAIQECEIGLVIEKAEQFCLPSLPWQVDVEALKGVAEASFGYSLNDAFIALSNPENENIAIRMLVSENVTQGGEEHLLEALFAEHHGRTWHVPAIFPEEQASIFESVGMEKQGISQWQMIVAL